MFVLFKNQKSKNGAHNKKHVACNFITLTKIQRKSKETKF